jgi:hypothetical protein
MPWTASEFAARHNHKLHGDAADTAARMASAMVKRGVPEGIAIATANKKGDRMMRAGGGPVDLSYTPPLARDWHRPAGPPEPVPDREEPVVQLRGDVGRGYGPVPPVSVEYSRQFRFAEGGDVDPAQGRASAMANLRGILREPGVAEMLGGPFNAWQRGADITGALRNDLRDAGLPVGPSGFAKGGVIPLGDTRTTIDRAVRSASRRARQHLDVGGMPEIPYFERQEARDISYGAVHPGGLVASAVPGRTDRHNINVPAGSYVLPADVVSGLGEGNTMAGAKVVDEMLSTGPWGTRMPQIRHGGGYGAIPRPPHAFEDTPSPILKSFDSGLATGGAKRGAPGKPIPIVVAGGEYIVRPDQVAAQGGGDIHRGHRILDKFVEHVRRKTVKTLKNLPGPVK